MPDKKILLPKLIQNSEESLIELVSCLWENESLSQLNTQNVILNLENTNFFSTELSAVIGIYFEELLKKGIPFSFENIKPNIKKSLSRTGFLSTYKQEEVRTSKFYNTSIEYAVFRIDTSSNIDDISDDISEYLQKNIFSHDSWPEDGQNISMSKIQEAIFELIDNILTHSNSDIIILAGQLFPQKNTFKFSICDSGIGIPNGVSSKVQYGLDSEKISWAATLGNTTKDEKNAVARGLGFYVISETIKNFGSLTIVSNHGFWKKFFSSEKVEFIKISDFNSFFPGTLVHLEFNLKQLHESEETNYSEKLTF